MDPAICSNCGRSVLVPGVGRCKSCHVYWQRYRRERVPAIARGRPCVDCGIPTGARGRIRCVQCFTRHAQGRSIYHLPDA
jgi:hypothetical protein